MKTKEEYLSMVPEYLDYNKWEKDVNRIFDAPPVSSDDYEYLNKMFLYKPMSMIDRWMMDKQMYEKEAEKNKHTNNQC